MGSATRGLSLVTLLLVVWCCRAAAPETIGFCGLFPLTGRVGAGVQLEAAARVAVEYINSDPNILPDTQLEWIVQDTATTQVGGLNGFFKCLDLGALAVVGTYSSAVTQVVANAAGIFGIPQVSYGATSPTLSVDKDFPLFSRVTPPDSEQGRAFAELVSLYDWKDTISGISTSDAYGVNGIREFQNVGAELDIRLLTYQQFLPGSDEVFQQVRELGTSKARVFLAFLLDADAQVVLREAIKQELVGPTYVWLCSDGCATDFTFRDSDNEVLPDIREASSGMIALVPQGGQGELYEEFLDDWETRDPAEYPGSGSRNLAIFAAQAYDSVLALARAYDQLIRTNANITDGLLVTQTLRNLTFVGTTGLIKFEANGDRVAAYDVVNIQDEDELFTVIGSWTALAADLGENNGFVFEEDPQFYDRTTNVPDLDVKPPRDYWDCEDGKMRYDPTGKEVDLTTPDGDDPDFISSHYRCDEFIDCDNMSDESLSCSPSFVAVFISFGIITGMLVLTIPFFVITVIAFGFIWKKRRIRLLSPVFLLGMCLAAGVGYISTFAWYGKPHTVACNFQPWLLGLSVNLMIAFLFAKTFRIWRIFKSPFARVKITDLQMLALVSLLMVPSVIILIIWTSFATPTTTIVELDGEDHFVCETGGLIGPPGGIVFFSIFVAYTAFLLLFGVFLAFVTRNVPSEYSESKLVGYSVYNLTFLAAVVIPVFFVLRSVSPVAAWIIRTLAILYGFTATLWLQFLPPLAMLIVHDKCAEVPPEKTSAFSDTQGSASSIQSRG